MLYIGGIEPQLLLQPTQPFLNAPFSLFNPLKGDSINAARPVVAAHSRHRRFQ